MSDMQFFINDYQEYEEKYLPIETYYQKGWYSVGFYWTATNSWYWGNGRTFENAIKSAKKELNKLKKKVGVGYEKYKN